MLIMNQPTTNPMIQPPRRFLLLPEEVKYSVGGVPRIRRYRLSSVGRPVSVASNKRTRS